MAEATYGAGRYGIDVYGPLVTTGSTGTGVLTIDPPTLVGAGGILAPPIVIPPQIGIAPPLAVVEVAFASNPTGLPVWVDISAYVEAFSITRGRQRELDRVQAGTLSLRLNNMTRRFDPTNAAGPYFGNILPMRRIRVRATYNNTAFPLYSGYVESWGQEWHGWQDAVVTVTASDAFMVLNLAQVNTSFPIQTSDGRVNSVLNAIGWTIGGPAWLLDTSALDVTTVLGPTGDRVVNPGQSTIQASVLANTSALAHLQDVADSEFGLLFTDREGAVTFLGRLASAIGSSASNAGTFGELEMPYVDILLSYDDTDVWNDVRITPNGGSEQVAADGTSQAQYFVRTLARTSLHNTGSDALGLAQMLLTRHKQPALQVSSMTLDGEVAPTAVYPQMLGRDIGDLVTVRRRPPAGGSMIEQVSIIQGIGVGYTAEGGIWSTMWRLSPADTATYWVLEDPMFGVLDSTSRLFF